jgi:hypothetical protein
MVEGIHADRLQTYGWSVVTELTVGYLMPVGCVLSAYVATARMCAYWLGLELLVGVVLSDPFSACW